MQKKIISNIIMFLAFLMIMSATAFAIDTKESNRFASYWANLSVGSNGDLDISFYVTASKIMDTLGASKITVQRHNGSSWITEGTITVNDAPEMQTSNAIRHSATIPYKPNYPGSKYRAVVTFYAKDSSGSSTAQAVAE